MSEQLGDTFGAPLGEGDLIPPYSPTVVPVDELDGDELPDIEVPVKDDPTDEPDDEVDAVDPYAGQEEDGDDEDDEVDGS